MSYSFLGNWKIETGVIILTIVSTNNNGEWLLVRGDIRCGGPPDYRDLRDKLRIAGVSFPCLFEAHRYIFHINQVELHDFKCLGDLDNSQLRVDYLLGNIDELGRKIKGKSKKARKDGEINQVLQCILTLSDIFVIYVIVINMLKNMLIVVINFVIIQTRL